MNDDDADQHDQVLRHALREEADTVHPRPSWDDVRDRAHRRRRRWIPAAAAVITLLLTAGLVALVSGDEQTGVVADGPGGPSLPLEQSTTSHLPTTTTDASTTTVPNASMDAGPDVEPLELPAGAPLGDDEMVVSIGVPNGDDPDAVEVVVLSKESGDVVRTLDDGHSSVEGGVYGLTLTPDRRTVLYTVATSACTSRIDAAAVDGSAEPIVVREDANQVAISPDGSRMAIETGDVCVSPPNIEVVPLEGGRTTKYPGVGPEGHAVESMVFADEDTLLHVLAPPVPSDPWPSLSELDLRSGTRTSVEPGPTGTEYRSLGRYLGRATALELHDAGADIVILEGHRIVDRLPVNGSGAVHGAMLDGEGAIVAFEGDGDVRHLTIDGRPLRSDVASVAV